MKRLILAFAALAAVSACSDSRERNIAVANQPDRPLRVAQPDTSDRATRDLASRGDQPVSPVEQQAPRAEPAPKVRPAPRPLKRATVRPKPPVDTATARGYAPPTTPDTVRLPDTSVVRDTVSAPPRDTARAAAPDTTTPAPATDTVATAHTDTLPADTTRSSSDSAVASSGTATAPAVNASGLDNAARTLPIGTEIHAALDDSISSRRDSAGRTITAQITQSVTGAGGRILIPAGSTVRLTVTRLASAKSKGSQGSLALKVDGIEVGGQLQNVQADVRAVPRELRSRGVTSGDAAKVGVGAVGGAVLGRVLGGNSKGAVIGGVVGAAGGAVVASQTATRDVVVKAKTPVTFVLTAPLVTP
jgi:glycine zipper 2TM protein